jgi:L-threonylcarbamoyladenylate synthase
MKETKILKPTDENIAYAKNEILKGEVVAIPTETVYGLAANAFNPDAIRKIFEVKGRPQDNPLIVHISDMEMLSQVASQVSQTAKKLANAFWGGPLTMILPKSEQIPYEVTAGLETVGVRMPSHPAAQAFIRACGVPLAAPSANLSGKPSPTTATHVYHDLNGKIDCILDGGECEVGVESTVVKVGDDCVEILRPGKITIDDFLKVVSTVTIDDGVFTQKGEDEVVASPGMKYRHYSPNAKVIMVEGNLSDFYQYVSKNADDKTGVLVFDGEESLFEIPCITYGQRKDSLTQASRLFDALREIDQHHELTKVFARMPKRDGVGLAVYNRLLRACGFEVVSLEKTVIVGLTGQTGAGKTTVSDYFREDGSIVVVDCDLLSRDVILIPEVVARLTEYFGEDILEEPGKINRKELGRRVFANEEDRIFLNSIMFPQIEQKIRAQIRQQKQKGYRLIVLDAPTLFESGANILCDLIISVIAPVSFRKERIIQRDNMTQQEAQNRIDSQYADSFYREKSDYIIENDGSLSALKEQTERMITILKEKINGSQA